MKSQKVVSPRKTLATPVVAPKVLTAEGWKRKRLIEKNQPVKKEKRALSRSSRI